MTGELMSTAKPFLEMKLHPTIILKSYYKALEIANKTLEAVAR